MDVRDGLNQIFSGKPFYKKISPNPFQKTSIYKKDKASAYPIWYSKSAHTLSFFFSRKVFEEGVRGR
ncbi:MAG: hypothetical protein J6I42_02795, partial [Clostridia bacterium]|nr:hypothetical protein [Clostridia bacterium]